MPIAPETSLTVGKATCDRCRSKKRKHWGSKQVEIAELQVYANQRAAVLTHFELCLIPQDENELLRTALTASRTNNSELNLMIQGQAEVLDCCVYGAKAD